jgi:DNA processing protein
MTDLPPSFYWLLLQRLPAVSAAAQRRLARHEPNSSAEERLQWSPTRLRAAGLSDAALHSIADWQRRGLDCVAAQSALRDQQWLSAHGVTLLAITDPDYPALLLEIADPPPLLYIWGDRECLAAPQLAVVGSRRPTRQGIADATAFAGALASAGFAVASGLARGIDAAAHQAALDVGGKTVAVMGTGLDCIYPTVNCALAEAIRHNGALVTEFPLGTPPRAVHFPSRNRIISGLSLGVLVVEAALKSGSLVTARLALEQNREVFAIPGSIHNPVSRGCNTLIRSGATLVQDARDILDELLGWSGARGAEPALRAEAAPIELVGDEAAVFAALGFELTALESILDHVALSVPAVLAALAELELLGLVENRCGSYLRAQACAAAAS